MTLKSTQLLTKSLITLGLLTLTSISFADKPVGITPNLMSISVTHNGKAVDIKRNQDNSATVIDDFAKTSRPCPPFCIQPMLLAPGIETLGEVEVIHYISEIEGGNKNILLIDSRTPSWVAKGTIPGSVNISWTDLMPQRGATTEGIMKIMMEDFNVGLVGDTDAFTVDEAIAEGNASEAFDFSNAKTLIMFCNGMWCGQSPASIFTLLRFGYPAEKMKWYRDGMQSWEILGLSTVKP